MTKHRLGLCAVMCALSALLMARQPETTQVFRAAANVTSVNVSVRDGNRPVGKLTAADFYLLDNGVAQTVSLTALEEIPIDVTVVLDASASVQSSFERLKRDVQEIRQTLRPDDRLRLVSFSTRVKEAFGFTPNPLLVETDVAGEFGATAFHNAVAAALMPVAEPGRPHLVMVLGDGADNVSLLSPADVRDVARRSTAVLQMIIRQDPRSFTGGGRGWLPFFMQSRDLDVIREAALDTGGDFRIERGVRRSLLADANDPLEWKPVAAVFRQILEEFRTSYVLWFEPKGVAAAGWHELKVQVKNKNYAVRARRGYFGG